jgi:6-phospho-3-hexuloisomerase
VPEAATSAVLAEINALAAHLPLDASATLCDALAAAPAVHVHGVGRCGLLMRGFAMRLGHLGLPVSVVGETTARAAEPGDLLLVGSGSGRTEGALAIARAGRAIGTQVVALTANRDAPLGALADETIVIPGQAKDGAGRASIQPPGSLFEQLLLVFLEETVLTLARRLDPGFALIRRRHANLE